MYSSNSSLCIKQVIWLFCFDSIWVRAPHLKLDLKITNDGQSTKALSFPVK